jgi:hypothetical protein
MASGEGPTQAIPAFFACRANPAFSDKNPYPGIMASACWSLAILIIWSPSVYAFDGAPASRIASSAVETCLDAESGSVYTEIVLIPSFFAVLMIRT